MISGHCYYTPFILYVSKIFWVTLITGTINSLDPNICCLVQFLLLSGKISTSCFWMPYFGVCVFDPWVGKIPWRRKWQPTPVLLPEKSHGQRSLVGYIPWGRKESDTTE